MLLALALFLFSALIIFLAGTRLAFYGDRIARLTGLGGIWVGTLLIATVTSLPEIVTVVSASLLRNPDIALGNLAGANCFNMLTFAAADAFTRSGPLINLISSIHLFIGALSIILMLIAAFFVRFGFGDAIFNVSLGSILIVCVYFLFSYRVFWLERIAFKQEAEKVAESGPIHHVYLNFMLASLFVVAAGFTLSYSADLISKLTGLGSSFIGSTLVALCTTLPELTVSLAAVRIGAYNIAAGNLFGSNAFNMLLILIADLAYRDPIFPSVSKNNLIPLFLAISLTALAVLGIQTRPKLSLFRINIVSYLIILIFIVGLFLMLKGGLSF